METHYQLDDNQFEHQFASCALDPAIFNHEAHLRLAWIHIRKYGADKAVDNICAQLLQFVAHVGAKDKYNKTLTMAAVRAVAHFEARSTADNFETFIGEFPRLKNDFRGLIASHYTQDIFNSPMAKQQYLEPDLLPFT